MFSVPRDLDQNLQFRANLLIKAEKDPSLQAQLKALCKQDFEFFVDCFVFTYDPRLTFFERSAIPLILFDAQREFTQSVIDAIMSKDDITLEKSRDEGATWMILVVFYWFWLFREGSDFLMGSMNIDSVHIKGKMSTLFPKLFFISKHLPNWLLPKGYNSHQHENYCRLENPELLNSISGESGESFATSGRYTAIFMDELAKWDARLSEISYEASHQATKCRIAISTPFGQYGVYYRLIANTTETSTRKARIHWSDDPRKTKDLIYIKATNTDYATNPAKNPELFKDFKGETSPTPTRGYIPTSTWYREECKRFMGDPEKGDNGIKQELDIEYLGTGLTYFDQNLVEQKLKECKPPLYKGELERIEKGDVDNGASWVRNFGKSKINVEFVENSNGRLWIWELPKSKDQVYTYQYSASCDPAKGLNGVNDRTSISIVDRETKRTVCRWYGQTQFVEEICINLNEFYHGAMMWNVDATGNSTVAINLDAYGLNLVVQVKETQVKKNVSPTIGFNFAGSAKPLLFQRFRRELKDDGFIDLDSRLFMQMKTFINDNGVLKGAGKGELQSHDDIVDDKALNLYCDSVMPNIDDEKDDRIKRELSKEYNIIESYGKKENARQSILL